MYRKVIISEAAWVPKCIFSHSFFNRYGNCLPYQSIRACDSLRSPGVDYVYLSYHRAGGDLSRYTRFFANSADFFIGQAPEQCVDLASKIFCHVFFPTCGNGTKFNPPAALCQETCEYVQSLCPSEWDQVAQYFERERPLGTNFINCNATGDYLEPLPHCCTNAAIVIPNNTRNITRNSPLHQQVLSFIFLFFSMYACSLCFIHQSVSLSFLFDYLCFCCILFLSFCFVYTL